MMAAIKSEFRKLFTVRSTYVITALALALVILFAFYIEGLRAGSSVDSANKLTSEVVGAVMTTGIFSALISALLMTHEYRYNTISYTLTSTSRARALLAKFIVISIFSIVFTLIMGTLSPLLTELGLAIKGSALVHQNFPVLDLLWRSLFVGWGYAMLGIIFAVIIRNQVGTLVAVFFTPSTIEPLLGLLLKDNAIYLPYTVLTSVVQQQSAGASANVLSPPKAAIVFTSYLIIGWIVSFILFTHRDAN